MELLSNDNPPYIVSINRGDCEKEDLNSIIQNYVNLETIVGDTSLPNQSVMKDSNSLFLSVARALIHQLLICPKYEFYLKHYLDVTYDLKLFSDMHLQQILRRKLCLHWLRVVKDAQYVPGNVYKR